MVLTTIVALLHTATSKATQVLLGRGKPRSSTASRKQHARRPARRSAALPATSEKRAKVKASDDCVVLPGVRTLASKKSVWLLDQFGVLHDGTLLAGKTAYPAAVEATRRLHEAGCRLFIISNSSRRSSNTLKKLEPMGFDPSWFSGVVTSGGDRGDGEDIHPAFTSLGDACLHFTWSSRGAVGIEGLSLSTVTSPAEADFILAHGTECVNGPGSAESSDEERAAGAVDTPLEAMREMLVEAADRGLPMVVANPDVVTVGGGALKPMPGTLAKWYEEMGGEVHLMGKPAPIIYERVMEMTGVDASEVIAVGDSLEHDVAGAQGAECESVFICGGIHAEDLGMASAAGLTAADVGDGETIEPPPQETIGALSEKFTAFPTYAAPVFKW